MKDHKEIERAWVLKSMPHKDLITHSIPHTIYYLFNSFEGEMRIVHREHQDHPYNLTIKSKGDLSRDEWEERDLPKWAFNILEPQAKYVINKTRHFINYDSFLLEIDEYSWREDRTEGGGPISLKNLIRLECEFSSEEEANKFTLPYFINSIKEVTSIKSFKNARIAQSGPTWEDLW